MRDVLTVDVISFLKSIGYKADSDDAWNYAEAAANYINMCNEYDRTHNYTIKEWYIDTKFNYPDDLLYFK